MRRTICFMASEKTTGTRQLSRRLHHFRNLGVTSSTSSDVCCALRHHYRHGREEGERCSSTHIILAQNLNRLFLDFFRQPPVRPSAEACMRDRFVASFFQPARQTPCLSFADGHLGRRLLLRDQLPPRFLQPQAPVAIPLSHQKLAGFQLPRLLLSIGRSYFARLGHDHFAPSGRAIAFDSPKPDPLD
jgi:hypothetical protein